MSCGFTIPACTGRTAFGFRLWHRAWFSPAFRCAAERWAFYRCSRPWIPATFLFRKSVTRKTKGDAPYYYNNSSKKNDSTFKVLRCLSPTLPDHFCNDSALNLKTKIQESTHRNAEYSLQYQNIKRLCAVSSMLWAVLM